ncbi:hypothetical protein OIU85_022702 [Salix viminalis]|uniref:Pentatricopeptide repeat-containing protein n=1 Tax=Salix viminalis TaxID=40686 RepID=A0A9Q0Z865_SALVM|nr:hypothetical protein OIU85_022702 [Salix viminalis]
MISLYDHHNMQDEIIEVFADMEELGVRPDEDTVWRVARAFKKLGQEEKQELVLERPASLQIRRLQPKSVTFTSVLVILGLEAQKRSADAIKVVLLMAVEMVLPEESLSSILGNYSCDLQKSIKDFLKLLFSSPCD